MLHLNVAGGFFIVGCGLVCIIVFPWQRVMAS